MGVDTNVILTKAPTATDLLIWASKNYKQANLVAAGPDGDHFFYLNFMDGKNQRNLSVFVDNSVACDYRDLYTGDATFISMGMWGNSEVIARKLVSEFGGWLRVNDCEDDWKRLDED